MPASPGATSSWMPYVQVEDLDRYTKKAEELGAKVIMPVTQISSGGAFSIIRDPAGACIGLYQP